MKMMALPLACMASREIECQTVSQESELSPLIFLILMDIILDYAREGLMNEILYADALILICRIFYMEKSKEKFTKEKCLRVKG